MRAKIASVGDDFDAIAYVRPCVLSKSVARVFVGGKVVGFVGSDTGSNVSEVVVGGVKGLGKGLEVPFARGNDEEIIGKNTWGGVVGFDYEEPGS